MFRRRATIVLQMEFVSTAVPYARTYTCISVHRVRRRAINILSLSATRPVISVVGQLKMFVNGLPNARRSRTNNRAPTINNNGLDVRRYYNYS